MWLAELELIDLRRAGTLCSTPTIDNPPRHTQARTVRDVNKSPLHKKLRPVKSYQKALEPPHYKGKMHQEYLKFIQACDQVFNTQPDVYCNDCSKAIYAQGYLLKNIQNAWYQHQDNQGLNGITWKDFLNFLLECLKPATMRNIDVNKCYLEARQTPGQTFSNFTAYPNQLES